MIKDVSMKNVILCVIIGSGIGMNVTASDADPRPETIDALTRYYPGARTLTAEEAAEIKSDMAHATDVFPPSVECSEETHQQRNARILAEALRALNEALENRGDRFFDNVR